MNVLKSPAQPNAGRRSFVWKMGAAMSAALAAAVPGMAKPRIDHGNGVDGEAGRLSRQLGILEDEKAIHHLHRTYEACLDSGRYEEVVALFAENGEVVHNGGVFEGKMRGISRLYCDCFRSGLTGKTIEPAAGFQTEPEMQETITVAADRLSAKALFPYSMQVGRPIQSDLMLVKMARLHGGGVMKWCESGICEASYVKDGVDGRWKIKRLDYRVLLKTNYRPGKSYADRISTVPFTAVYPEDPAGPDRLIAPEPMPQKA